MDEVQEERGNKKVRNQRKWSKWCGRKLYLCYRVIL